MKNKYDIAGYWERFAKEFVSINSTHVVLSSEENKAVDIQDSVIGFHGLIWSILVPMYAATDMDSKRTMATY